MKLNISLRSKDESFLRIHFARALPENLNSYVSLTFGPCNVYNYSYSSWRVRKKSEWPLLAEESRMPRSVKEKSGFTLLSIWVDFYSSYYALSSLVISRLESLDVAYIRNLCNRCVFKFINYFLRLMNVMNNGQMDRGNENPNQHLPCWLRKTTKKPQSCWDSNQGPPECESRALQWSHLARLFYILHFLVNL